MYQYKVAVNNLNLDVYSFQYEPVESNMYFIPVGSSGIVFDPNISENLLELFETFRTQSVQIILTHEHYDHITGVEWLQERLDAPLFCQEECARAIYTNVGNSPRFVALATKAKDLKDGGHRYEELISKLRVFTLKADKTFSERGEIKVGPLTLECFHTPGHSPGSACYILDGKYVFTGDTLIQNTPTILRFKTSRERDFEAISRPFLRSLDKNTMVFPGHGEPFGIKDAKYL